MKPSILLLVDQSNFTAELYDEIAHLGYRPVIVDSESSITSAMLKAPVLTLVEVEASSFEWQQLVRYIKGPAKKNNHVPVLGFGLALEADTIQQALDAGCSAVVEQTALQQSLAALIESHKWRLNESMRTQPLPPLAQRGIAEFNQGLYFECHETLEDVWNDHQGIIRVFYQGILQIAVGYLHIRRHNWRGAVKVLARGIPKVAHFQPVCQSVDVADLVTRAQEMHAMLLELGPERIDEFDQISLPVVKLVQ